MTRPTPTQLIDHFGLEPLPAEGGYFRQTYRAPDHLRAADLPPRYTTDKPAGTAILFLLTAPDGFSALHRLPTDEIFHFYLGDPVESIILHTDQTAEQVILGPDVLNGQRLQHVVPAHTWQGHRVAPGGEWALLGSTMAPGFTYTDYEGASRDALTRVYPDHADIIRALTRPAADTHMPPGY